MNWDEYFCKMAILVSSKSKDRSTKCGAVIVAPSNAILSTGYNGFPRGVNDDDESRHERPKKYSIVKHAEENACINASREGIRLEGSRIYLSWGLHPCCSCCGTIINAGIREIIGIKNRPFTQRWSESMEWGKELLMEANISCREIEVDLSCI